MRHQHIYLVLVLAIGALLQLGIRAGAASPAEAGLTRAVSLWDSEHGLPSSKINAVTETPDGYIWLATAEGLVRFDGLRFTVFEHHSTASLPGSVIDDLLVDHRGVLWILAQGHIIRRDGDVFVDVSNHMSGETANRIWLGVSGQLFIATNHYVFHCDLETPVRTGAAPLQEVCYSFADLPGGEVLAGGSQGRLYSITSAGVATVGSAAEFGNGSVTVAPDRRGGIWVACVNGVYHGLRGVFAKYPTTSPLTDLAWMWTTAESTPNLLCDAAGTVWVQNGGKLFRSRNGVLAPCLALDEAPMHCTHMGLDAGGRLWAVETNTAGNAVLYAWTGQKFEKIVLNAPLFGSLRIPVFTDRDNGYWIGAQQGLLWSRVQTCRTFGTDDGLPSDELTAVTSAPDGLRVGTRRSGLFRFDGQRFVRDAGAPVDARITSLTTLPPGELWVGREGMEISQLLHGALSDFPVRYPALKWPNVIRLAVRDRKGCVWASDGVVLFRCDAHGVEQVAINSSELFQGDVTQLFVDSHDNVWVAGLGGFLEVHDGQVTPYAPNPKLCGWKATSICEGGDGAIWVGYDGAGLARCKNGQVTVLTAAGNSLPSDYVNGIALDNNGRIWLGGSRGVFCVEESQLIALADGRAASATFDHMERMDGVAGGAIQSRFGSCVTKDDQGMLWFVCEQGVVRVDPDQYARASVPTVLEAVRVNGNRLPFGRTIVVEPGAGDLNIDYTAIRFVGAQRLRFEYRLRGYNARWVDIGAGRSAAYMNLPPGTYTFDVRSYDAQSSSPLSRASVTVILKPYFYQTTMFRVAAAFAALMTLWLLMRLRTRILVQRTRKLEAIVEARTHDLIKANETVAQAYEQLEEQKQELVLHNDLLQNTQAELEAQNDELQCTQAELEAQNNELLKVRAELEREKEALAEANIHLNSLAITDGLTGLTNHRGFQDQLEHDWAIAMRHGHPLSLLLLDVDHFKQYNDTYGHPQGDVVLKTIARILMTSCRDGDTTARYGGEEFVIVAPQTDFDGVAILAERLRAAIEGAPWTERQVTASIGVVTYTPGIDNCRDLIEYADKALYYSKTHGRNRVTPYAQIKAEIALKEHSVA